MTASIETITHPSTISEIFPMVNDMGVVRQTTVAPTALAAWSRFTGEFP